jgi:hypothetical protein
MKTILMALSIALMCVTGTAYAKHTAYAKQSQCVWMNGAYNCYTQPYHYNRYNHHYRYDRYDHHYRYDRHRDNNWSDGEKVIAGLLIINAIAQSSKPDPYPVSYAYRAGAEARRMEEQQRAAERAYMCGYTGTCKP